ANAEVRNFLSDYGFETVRDVALESPTDIIRIRADYLIGADGASSIVRKWLGIEFDGFTYPEKFLCLSTKQEIRDEITDLAYVNYISDADEWMAAARAKRMARVGSSKRR